MMSSGSRLGMQIETVSFSEHSAVRQQSLAGALLSRRRGAIGTIAMQNSSVAEDSARGCAMAV